MVHMVTAGARGTPRPRGPQWVSAPEIKTDRRPIQHSFIHIHGWLHFYTCASPRMFIFTKRFPLTPIRIHNHSQLGGITHTDVRVNGLS